LICHEKPYNSLQDDFYILSCFESEEGRRSQESGVTESGEEEERRKKEEGRRRKKEGRKKEITQLPITNYQLPITNY